MSALLPALLVVVVAAFLAAGELSYLVPYRDDLLRRYGVHALALGAVLVLNLFAAFFTLNRKFLLKDTGRRLSHLDRQLHTQDSELSAEIRERFGE